VRKRTIGLLLLAATALATVAFMGLATASTPTCTNTQSLVGSRFEIDTNANTAVNGPGAGCLDWESASVLPTAPNGTLATNDILARDEDDSFGQGTAEDNPNPTVVTGSIPPNKSNLLRFGVFTEQGGDTVGKYLELYWTRANTPSGTTNMDFELNKNFCDPAAPTAATCALNGPNNAPDSVRLTPNRETGDKLITYDLSKGGTVPSISIRTWNDTTAAWGPATLISGTGNAACVPATGANCARGSVNTTDFTPSAATGIGARDAFTFGEAAIDFDALFSGNTCGKFGSAYLKSRSSDSFTSEIKDFIKPEQVNISNCTTLTTAATATATLGSPIKDTATLTGATTTPVAGGTMSFKVYGPFTGAVADDVCDAAHDVTPASGFSLIPLVGPDANGTYTATSPNFTPTAVGRYQWVASYTGDANNAASTTLCKDANEASIVTQPASSLTTAQRYIPQDTATLTGTGTYNGELVFNLFRSLDDCQNANNDNLDVYTETVDVPAATTAGTSFSTSNNGNPNGSPAGYQINIDNDQSPHFWEVIYRNDTVRSGVTSACVEDTTSFTIDNTTPPA
jgi:hypothetical protein